MQSEPERIPQATPQQLAAAGLGNLEIAPERRRVDLAVPTFSHPTEVTNPLFPISGLSSAILSGHVEGKPFHTETTLLPETRIVEWNGRQIETLVFQYVAYLDGRVEEVALDHYAQADDGSVWYFGEDVFDYRAGVIVSTEGTWFAGKDRPPAMIMPAAPQVGEVYRSENVPGLVFEEVTVKRTGITVNGPHGPVRGAMVGEELHSDGTREDKTFAPGYGEFFTGGDVEAMALAAPVDDVAGPIPSELETLSTVSSELFDLSRSGNWKAARVSLQRMNRAWTALRARQVPSRLAAEMTRALRDLAAGVAARDRKRTGTASVDVAQSTLDLELSYRLPVEIDRARFELWERQLLVDAAAGDVGGVRADVSVMEWIRDRFSDTLDPLDRTRIDTALTTLRASATDDDLQTAAVETARLRGVAARLVPVA